MKSGEGVTPAAAPQSTAPVVIAEAHTETVASPPEASATQTATAAAAPTVPEMKSGEGVTLAAAPQSTAPVVVAEARTDAVAPPPAPKKIGYLKDPAPKQTPIAPAESAQADLPNQADVHWNQSASLPLATADVNASHASAERAATTVAENLQNPEKSSPQTVESVAIPVATPAPAVVNVDNDEIIKLREQIQQANQRAAEAQKSVDTFNAQQKAAEEQKVRDAAAAPAPTAAKSDNDEIAKLREQIQKANQRVDEAQKSVDALNARQKTAEEQKIRDAAGAPAPAVAKADNDEIVRLREQIQQANQRADESQKSVAMLSAQLAAQQNAAEQKAHDKDSAAPAVAQTENVELEKLREQITLANRRADESQKSIAALSAQLAAQQKAVELKSHDVPTATAVPADDAAMEKLRDQIEQANQRADDAQKSIDALNAQQKLAEQKALLDAESMQKAQDEAIAKVQAEADARAQAQAEVFAKKQAEELAKIRAENEANAKVQAQAQLTATKAVERTEITELPKVIEKSPVHQAALSTNTVNDAAASATADSVLVRQTLLFHQSVSALPGDAAPTIQQLARQMKNNSDARMIINAYADASLQAGSAARRLSLQRAVLVRDELNKMGVPINRMAVSAQTSDPGTINPDRVEITVE